ncbi:MAG: hypothetical protein QOH09_155 [Pseudonocardiales bacterium]|nr:hypothetical protein [Pseudonocardiales bacterium]
MPRGFHDVPNWLSPLDQGASVAVSDVTGNGTPDLIVLAVDSGRQPNRAAYRIGRDLDAGGDVVGGWTQWHGVPNWTSRDTQGAGIAVTDLNRDGRRDVVIFMVNNAAQLNTATYRVGRDLDADGKVTGGWSAWHDVPWFSWENQGAGIAIADLSGNGRPDLIVMTIDNPPMQNRGVYRVGRDLDQAGNVTGGWSDWVDMPGWFSWDNQGGGVAVADTTGNGHLDIIIFGIDNPPQQNQAFYRIAFDVNRDGVPAGAQQGNPQAGWSSLLGVNNWFSWENQGSGIAVVPRNGIPHLVVLAADHPPAGSVGFYTTVQLTDSPEIHGRWQVLPFNSEVLAIHAAMLHTGRVLFFSGSGNNTARVADHKFGSVAAGLYTSVVWDPQAPAGQNFKHPPTIFRGDGRPFDFFCGGDTFLGDGRVLSAGGTQDYNKGNDLGQRDVAIFDPVTEQWANTAHMENGRWYPQLLLFPDGHVLTVSGKNQFNGDLNPLFEIYDPVAGQWLKHNPPQSPDFNGLPFYAHLFLMTDGRVFFSGGRMDDGRFQRPGIMAFAPNRIDFQVVPAIVDGFLRNQSSSVLLPPAQDQRVMIVGGGPPDDRTSATGTAEVVDLTQPNPAYQLAMPLSLPRIHLNAVLLPDRTVFVSGGAIIHEETGVAPIPRLQSEIYDPATDTWKPGAVASVVRMYHSVALLMPDGRVMTTSGKPPPYGDLVPWQPPQPNEEMQIEIYSPPYMFVGGRPAIGHVADEWHYGEAIDIATAQPGNVLWAELIRSGVTTHAFDNSQRLVDLPINGRAQGVLTVHVPATPTLAPPGRYMLFLVDQNHVPSTATWIHLS